jgi:hypothetical protein
LLCVGLLTLWYVPFGSIAGIVVVVGVMYLRKRGES